MILSGTTRLGSLRILQANLSQNLLFRSLRPKTTRSFTSASNRLAIPMAQGIEPPLLQSQQFGNFDRIKHIKLDFTDVTVSQWRSRKTGLTMLHLDYEGATRFESSKP